VVDDLADQERQRSRVAFMLLHLSPEERVRCFNDALEKALAKRSDLDRAAPAVVAYVTAVLERIVELEQMPGGTA
jgi:hypothetical protein